MSPPDDDRPLEWWEEVQVDLFEAALRDKAPGVAEQAARFRAHPSEWRAFRELLRERAQRTSE